MQALSNIVTRMPWLFIAGFLAVTLGFGLALPQVEIDPEVKNQLPEDMPARLNIKTIEEHFGGSELVLVVIEAPDVLDPAVLERLEGIASDLEDLEFVDGVISPFNLKQITGADGQMEVLDAIEPGVYPSDAEERAALAQRLAGNDLVFGNVIARDFSAISAIASLSSEATDEVTMAEVQRVIDAHPGPGVVDIGGMPDVRTHLSEDIRTDLRKFLPIGLFIVLAFLYVCFRQLRGMILPFSVVVMSVIVSMGLIPLLGWKVQMLTVVLPVILLAVANDYGIHLMARYQEENVPGNDRSRIRLARVVLEDLGPPVFAAGVTTMAGLLCLTTHIVVPARQLGILAAIGVGFALCASLGFIPAVLAVLPVPTPLASLSSSEGPTGLERLLHRVASAVVRNPRPVIVGVLLFAGFAATGFFRLQVDTNPVNYYDSDAPVAVTTATLNRHFGGSTELSVLFEGDIQDPAVLGRIEALESALAGSEDVGFTSSISGVVKMMNAAVTDDEAAGVPDDRKKVAELFFLYSMGGDPADFERMVDFEYEHALLTARINTLSTTRTADVVQLARDTVAADDEVVVSGFGVLFSDLVDAVVEGQVSSLGLSLFLVFGLVALTFRSLGAGVYAVIPLLLAMPVLFGLMGHLGIELNVVTAMLSSIVVGVGVDYTLHFLWRYRAERAEGHGPEAAVLRTLTTAGRGIVFNALSVIVGFSVVLLSNFLPVQFFGFLVVVSIGACLVGALVLLPSMVLVFRPRFLEPRQG